MDEARSVVSIRASPIEGMSVSVDGSLQKLESASIMNDCENPISPSLVETDKKNQRKEICSVYSGQKPTVYINPMVQPEADSDNSLTQMIESTDESKLMEGTSGIETAQAVSNVLRIERSNHPPREIIDKNTQKGDRRRRARGTIVWEPLLVPSEMDGKIEMVTALKKVGSNFISAPRGVPKKQDIHLVKSPPFRPSSKSFLTPVAPMKAQKSLVHKVSDSTDVAHHVTTVPKPRASGSNIKVQMDKAIAEKEASILKEIESAMREAAKLKSKSSIQSSNTADNKVSNVLSEQSKVEPVIKATPSSGIKRKKTDLLENSEGDGSDEAFEISVSLEGTLLPESNTVHSKPDMKDKLTSLSNNEMSDVNNVCSIVKTSDALQSTSTPKTIIKDLSTNKILTSLGTVVTTSVASAGGELQGMHKILTVPSKVAPAVTSSGKEINPINRIVHAATNLNPNSTTSLQRILVLTTPTGMKNSAGENITIMPSLVPISPIVSTAGGSASSLSAKPRSGDKNTVKKSFGSGEKKDNSSDVHLIVTNLPVASEEAGITEESNLGQFSGTGLTIQANTLNSNKPNSQSNIESTPKNSSTSQSSSSSRRKQKTHKAMNRELENLVIDCNNVQPSSQSRSRASRPSPKSSDEKSLKNAKGRFQKETSAPHLSENKKVPDQKSPAMKSEKSHSSDRKRQKLSHSPKPEKKDSTKPNNVHSLKERLQKMEQLYDELPPAQPHISLTSEDFCKLRNSFRNNLHNLNLVTESIKHFINMNDLSKDSSSPKKSTLGRDYLGLGSPSKEKDAAHILCRLCGGFFKNNCVVPLFSELSKEKNVLSMFNTILPQSPPLKEQDGLPQHVCLSCIDKLTLCFNIINQFLQADKDLRKVLQVKSDDSVGEGTEVTKAKEKLSPLRVQKSIPLNSQSEEKDDLPTRSSSDKFRVNLKTYERHSLSESGKRKRTVALEKQNESQKDKEKKTNSLAETEKSPDTNTTSGHKEKRRRSESPRNNKKVHNESLASKTPAGCIDLSRLDPEFNDGFEVEWCLDEETIRSSLVPEEELDERMDPVATGTDNDVSLKIVSKPGKPQSVPAVQTHVESSTNDLISYRRKDVLKKDEPLGTEMSKYLGEASKSSETRQPVRETSVNSALSQVSSREKLKSRQKSTPTQETYKCSHCPSTFTSKQEAFLHKVMEHEEELMSVMKSQETKLYSGCAQRTKDPVQQNLVCKAEAKKSESKSGKGQETSMCDQCGQPFPNEYSLYIHKCVSHENLGDGQPLEKDAKGVEYKIINSKDMSNETLAQKVAEESEGKILVKCGTGMLWVSSSKLQSEEHKNSSQGSGEGDGVANVSVENHILPLDQAKESTSYVSSPEITNLNSFKCVKCNSSFSEKAMLSNHLKAHHAYSCSECQSSFVSLKALNRHQPVHIPADHLCDECGLVLGDSKKLLQHRKEHTRNLPHLCDSCGKRFPNEQTLEVHETVHFDKGGSFSCTLCKKSFFFKHSLVRHGSQHASNRLQKCSLCFRVLKSCDQLRKHVALHHLTKNYVCFCKQTFPSPKELVEHRYLKHSYAEIFCARNKVEIVEPFPLHQCSICFSILTSRQNLLKHHHASHKSMWPFYCIQCSRKYISKSHLTKHECHRKYSAFQCRICGKIFQSKKIFGQHKKIHNIQKWKFLCRHCGDIFQISGSRLVQKINNRDRPFCCPKCLHLSNEK